jgi:hypothetical protein
MAKDDHELTFQLFFLKINAKGLVAVRPLAWAAAACVILFAIACLPLIARAIGITDSLPVLSILRGWRSILF